MTAIYWPDFLTTYLPPLPSDALSERDPSSYWFYLVRIAGLQSREGRTMIDTVVWAQYISATDTQTDRQPATSPQQMPCTVSGGNISDDPTSRHGMREATDTAQN